MPGLNKIPIVCASVKVDESDTVDINGNYYSINVIEKKDFEDSRKILNTNTLRSSVTKKAPELAKDMCAASKHTEIRRHAVVMTKCVKKLDGAVCSECKKKPSTMPAETAQVRVWCSLLGRDAN